ncbi:MAG: hypothetical protein NUV96_01000 [Candidatus Colwellbacteria bacterium]|nr:hypothetical protein [Candidatus Colwellbacteria bacterium]
MVTFSNTLIILTILFVLYTLFRFVLGLKVCALCAAVSTTWLGLLVMRLIGFEIDPLIIGIFMGGSAVGIMYLLEKKMSKDYGIFKFPFLLTLFAFIYLVLTDFREGSAIYLIVLSLWIVFLTLFLVGGSAKIFKEIGKKLIECCKNW